MPENSELTPMQMAFCQAVVDGNNQADAYRIANPKAQSWTDNAVRVSACRLMAMSNVKLMVDTLRAELAEKCLWTREESVRALKGVIANPDKAGDITAAVKELNAMHGFNAPVKMDHGGLTIVINKPVDDD